jgi:hypothetical protein
VPDFNTDPWANIVLVTPQNSVKTAWNRASLRKHSAKTGNYLYVVDAEDTVGNKREPANMEQKVTIASMKLDDTKRLTNRIEICVGMLVMVMLNLATKADLANGSWGIIEDIVLDPREEADKLRPTDEGIIWLQYPLAMILFRPFHYEFEPFPGFEPGLIPIFLSKQNFNIHYRQNPKTKIH